MTGKKTNKGTNKKTDNKANVKVANKAGNKAGDKADIKNQLVGYLDAAKSPAHVVKYAAGRLKEAGFVELAFDSKFDIKAGGKYYCTPYDSVLFAFSVSTQIKSGKMHIACAHTDSPSFKIKPLADMGARANVNRINVEPYGGSLKRTWFDRPLAVAGQLVLKGDSIFAPKRVMFDSEKPWFIIPSLAPHMDREIEEKKLDAQKELIPVCSLVKDESGKSDKEESGREALSFVSVLADKAGVKAEDILDYDLNLYVSDKAQSCGINEELLLAPRIDNVGSVAALVEGMIDGQNDTASDDNDLNIIALFDNEEIGSRTKQGADSMIFSWIIDRIFDAELFNAADKLTALAHSTMLSVDGAHAVHPNYPEKADETSKAFLGKGIVLKTSASQRYVSDASMSGILKQICEKYDIMLQAQANRSGTPGGQTLGPIESSFLPIPAADLGMPMLAMHSCMETVAISDYEALYRLMCVWNAQR